MTERHIRVKVYAGAHRQKVVERGLNALELYVEEPAQNNLANKRVVILVGEHYGVPPSTVRIVSGHHKPSKLISISSVS